MNFRKLLLITVLVLAMSTPHSAMGAQVATPTFDGETKSIDVELEASGIRVATKVDEGVCAFGFPLLVDAPDLKVLTEDGDTVSTTALGIGNRHESNDLFYCSQTYQIDVPSEAGFRVEIAPYFVEEYTAEDAKEGSALSIVIHREEGDPFPLSPLPVGGPVEGTDDILIVGRLELLGTHFEDFITMPIVGCAGGPGYEDIQAGMQITIKDETGTIIGLAELIPDPTEDMAERCQFYFTAEVPASTFYTFESGRRGGITVSHDELVSDDYEVSLILGR